MWEPFEGFWDKLNVFFFSPVMEGWWAACLGGIPAFSTLWATFQEGARLIPAPWVTQMEHR